MIGSVCAEECAEYSYADENNACQPCDAECLYGCYGEVEIHVGYNIKRKNLPDGHRLCWLKYIKCKCLFEGSCMI